MKRFFAILLIVAILTPCIAAQQPCRDTMVNLWAADMDYAQDGRRFVRGQNVAAMIIECDRAIESVQLTVTGRTNTAQLTVTVYGSHAYYPPGVTWNTWAVLGTPIDIVWLDRVGQKFTVNAGDYHTLTLVGEYDEPVAYYIGGYADDSDAHPVTWFTDAATPKPTATVTPTVIMPPPPTPRPCWKPWEFSRIERFVLLRAGLYYLGKGVEADLDPYGPTVSDAMCAIAMFDEYLGWPLSPEYAIQGDDNRVLRARVYTEGIFVYVDDDNIKVGCCNWGVIECDGEQR